MMLSRSSTLAARSAAAGGPKPVCRMISVRAASVQVAPKPVDAPVAPEAEKPVIDADAQLPDVQPSTKEVQQFLNTLVTETSIAELHLQVGTFELKVRRSLTTGGASVGGAPAAPAPAAAPAYSAPQTLVITKAPAVDTLKTMEESVDESLVPILSPKVGIFRRGRYAAGKRVGKGNTVNEGEQVKKGQTLGYVEQLGTFVPVESPQAGEVVKFLVNEGAAVEYRQEVVELAPFFGGHIIGDSKYA